VRRPKKVATAKGGAEDKKLAATLKKLEVKPIGGVEEVIFHKADGSTVVFKDPKRAWRGRRRRARAAGARRGRGARVRDPSAAAPSRPAVLRRTTR